jgi:16S rRNA (cytosine967-C5)-methyltransferase
MNIDRPPRTTEDRHPPDAGDEDVEDLDLPEQEPPYPFPVIRRAMNGAELSTRGAAIHLLTLWEQASHTPMDQLLGEYLDACSLSPSDRGFLSELCYGGVRLRGSVRFLADLFMDRPFLEAVRTVRSAIAVGTYQRVWLRTPAHAAVAESVDGWRELIEDPKQAARDSGYINAVLRSLCEAVEDVDEDLGDPTDAVRVPTGWARIQGLRLQRGRSGRIQRWSIQSSHPPELIRRWLDRYPEEKVRQLLTRNNETPPLFIVLKQGRELDHQIRVMKKAGIHAKAAQGAPQTLDVKRGTRVEKIPGFVSGDFWVQDLTARRLALRMPKREGARLLDMCAAPGGKLATLLDRGGISRVLACDLSEQKLRRIAENLQRLQLHDCCPIHLMEVDRDSSRLRIDESFDQVLVDAPCSNSGVLNRRHEARWRFSPEVVSDLEQQQLALLRAAIRHLAMGGHLLYSTCSVEPQENQDVIRRTLEQNTELRLIEEIDMLPGDLGGDGGYAALMQRVER